MMGLMVLQEKRQAFPRFYFLGDDDLLEILGQSTNPTVIQSHLKKLFQVPAHGSNLFSRKTQSWLKGISQVQFDDDKKSIQGMISQDGELVALRKPVKVLPEVEVSLVPPDGIFWESMLLPFASGGWRSCRGR